ncbi:MAG: GxxExxY protein [Gemmatimonadaceae bacterium]|nr:GxxExxY protein [Gemmatimonadaceae bacterium]
MARAHQATWETDRTEGTPDADLTHRVIGCFLVAYRGVGFGYPEAFYSAALEILFRDAGIRARREHGMDVMFRGVSLGRFRLDYLIEDSLILELKAGHQMPPGSRAQLLTYLRMAKKRVGLLLFFGPSPEIERVSL